MKLVTRITLPLTLTALAATGCSGQDAPAETVSPAQSASASPTPSASPTAPKTPTASPKPTRTAAADATTPAAAQTAPADDGMTTSLSEFLASGGVCFADYFPAGPLTASATAEVQDYCASQAPAAQVAPEDERAECEALDNATASSGAIQYCYMEYGIDPAAPLRGQDPYAGLSDAELEDLPVTEIH